MKKQHLNLTEKDRVSLEAILSKSIQKLRIQNRAKALQMLDEGKTYKEVEQTLKVSYPTVLKWSKNYQLHGLNFLEDQPRSGRPSEIRDEDRAKIMALAGSPPPPGYAKWSLRLLSNRVVELEIMDEISHTEIGRILKKNELQPHGKK